MGSKVLDVLVTSLLAIGKVGLVTIAGIIAGYYPKKEPLLDKETVRKISQLCSLLFLPCLVTASIGASLSVEKLAEFGPLLLFSVAAHILSACLAWLCGKLLPVDRVVYKAVTIAIIFPNAGSLPLLLMESLCEQPLISANFPTPAECFEEATSMIFGYLLVWHLLFFLWGYYRLAECDELDACKDDAARRQSLLLSSLHQLEAKEMGEGEEDEGNTGEVEGGDVEDDREAEAAVGAMQQEAAATAKMQDIKASSPTRWEQLCEVARSPPLIGTVVGIILALLPQLQSLLFKEPKSPLRPVGAALQAIGSPLVVLQTLVMAGSLTHTQRALQQNAGSQDHEDVKKSKSWSPLMTALVFLLCRLVVVPAAGYAVFYLLQHYTEVLGQNSLMQLVLLLQLSMPSAQLVLVTLNHLGVQNMATKLAQLYIYQYLASVLTMPGWSALALALVY
ncbi:unnamed protein product [Chrysoparadoxa australica]